MERGSALFNTSVQFLDTSLVLIHIPLDLLAHFVKPLVRLLTLTGQHNGRPWAFALPFANISITTVECSVVCDHDLAHKLFAPILEHLDKTSRDRVAIGTETFVVLQVSGEGVEAAQRVLHLTAPLALAGICIFFITTYYGDFILVPQNSQYHVVSALEARGFSFFPPNRDDGSRMTNIKPQLDRKQSGVSSSSRPGSSAPTSIAECQAQTLATLRENDIFPTVDRQLLLATCAGHRSDAGYQSKLTSYITACIISDPGPRFLSITLTDMETISLTLDRSLLALFPDQGRDVLLMSEEVVVPIMLDLRGLPDESAGIVCGVAGRMIEQMQKTVGPSQGFDMSYLSTAKAGNVIVREEEVDAALAALGESETTATLP